MANAIHQFQPAPARTNDQSELRGYRCIPLGATSGFQCPARPIWARVCRRANDEGGLGNLNGRNRTLLAE